MPDPEAQINYFRRRRVGKIRYGSLVVPRLDPPLEIIMGSHQQPDPAATQAPPPLFGGFVTGHGTSVGVSQQALDFARQLLAVEEGPVSTAAEDLPVGTTWPLLNVVSLIPFALPSQSIR
jgi:BRCA2 repeat